MSRRRTAPALTTVRDSTRKLDATRRVARLRVVLEELPPSAARRLSCSTGMNLVTSKSPTVWRCPRAW